MLSINAVLLLLHELNYTAFAAHYITFVSCLPLPSSDYTKYDAFRLMLPHYGNSGG